LVRKITVEGLFPIWAVIPRWDSDEWAVVWDRPSKANTKVYKYSELLNDLDQKLKVSPLKTKRTHK